MAEERMSAKQYAKFEKVFFLYGSTTKMVQPLRPDEWQPVAEQIWMWAVDRVDGLAATCTEVFLDPPPNLTETDTPSDARANGTTPHVKTKQIVVKTAQLLKSGETNGRKWTMTKIVDTENIPYTTFAGNRYAVGKEYTIDYEEVTNGEYVDYRIKEPK